MTRETYNSGFPTTLLTVCRIEYNKKPGKPSSVQVVKDPSVQRDDFYKSGTIHTGPGEPPGSRSRPTPKGKPKPATAITKGKLIRHGGPGGGPQTVATRPAVARPTPSEPVRTRASAAAKPSASRGVSQTQSSQSRPVSQLPQAAFNTQAKFNGTELNHTVSTGRVPPPPPPAQRANQKVLFKSKYTWVPDPVQYGDALPVEEGEILELEEDTGGKFHVAVTALSLADRFPLSLAKGKKDRWKCERPCAYGIP